MNFEAKELYPVKDKQIKWNRSLLTVFWKRDTVVEKFSFITGFVSYREVLNNELQITYNMQPPDITDIGRFKER